MQDRNKFSEWYKQRFNTIVEQPPNEVWDNISKELDINEVWNKVDSRLNRIDRRKTFVRRSAYASLLLLLFFISGEVIYKTYNKDEHKILIADNANDRTAAVASTNDNNSNGAGKEPTKTYANSKGATDVSKPSHKNSKVISSSKTRKEPAVERHENNIIIAGNHTMVEEPAIVASVNTDHESKSEEFFTAPIPASLVSTDSPDPLVPSFNGFTVSTDSDLHSQKPENEFHGFYSGGTFSYNNIWLLNQLTLSGLKANSLNETKIGFGNAYGISAGYNFNDNIGAEMIWHINSQSGQTYSTYDEGKYETRQIKKDVSVINFIVKYRSQSYNIWLNTPKSQNILLGVNLSILKRDRSVMPANDNDDDTDVYENIYTQYEHTSYGVMVGYEYEILAFHKIIFSSAVIGNFGVSNVFAGNKYIPESFNRTHVASLGFNIGAKYLIK